MSNHMPIENDRCRLCATLSLNRLPNIDPDTSNRISTLFQVQIDDDTDKLPRTICSHCLESVNAAWMFFERVHRAQRELLTGNLQKQCETFDEMSIEIPCIVQEQTNHFDDDPNETWPDYPWNCHICAETFHNEQFYRRHPCFQLHHRYFCVDCPKAFKLNYTKFIAHITEQHWERFQNHLLLQCDICQRWFHNREAQEFHRDNEHPNAALRALPDRPNNSRSKIMYDCEVCCKTFATRPNLDVHKRIHSGIKNFTCDQCGKSFSQKGNLAAHLLTHSTSRPFSCAVCDQTFKTLMRLRKHLEVHSGRKPHVCDICGREFRERGTLRGHVRIHTGAMPYSCEFCGKTFRFKGVLTTHRRQHTGERPYSCLECQHHFTNWPNYNKHMVRRHNINTSVHTRKVPAIPATGRPQRNPPGTVLALPQLPHDMQPMMGNLTQQDTTVTVNPQQHGGVMGDDAHPHHQQQHHHHSIDDTDAMNMSMLRDDHSNVINLVHMAPPEIATDGGRGVVYQATPTVIGMVGDGGGGYYTTYNVGGIAHVVTH